MGGGGGLGGGRGGVGRGSGTQEIDRFPAIYPGGVPGGSGGWKPDPEIDGPSIEHHIVSEEKNFYFFFL